MGKYDFLIVGAGLFGAVCARELTDSGYKVLVIDRRGTIGGNCHTYSKDNIVVHQYGPHIFHTNEKEIWDYVSRRIPLRPTPDFTPIAISRGEAFNLSFNMNTFARLLGTIFPDEARQKIEEQRQEIKGEPTNLEEQAISLVGRTIYERLIKGYTEKQWGRDCKELPREIIKRLPVRFSYNNTYYNDRYIGIPPEGWTPLFKNLLNGVEVRLGVDFMAERGRYSVIAEKIIYTGPIDEYFGYCLGKLEYRSLKFKTIERDRIFQGCAVMNWTDRDIPYTRTVEHRFFNPDNTAQGKSIVTYEYPARYEEGMEPYYPIGDEKNTKLYEAYKEMAAKIPNIRFGGRLGLYKYLDMDDTIMEALLCVSALKQEKKPVGNV